MIAQLCILKRDRMEHRRKPMVIKLRDHLHEGTKTRAAYIRYDGLNVDLSKCFYLQSTEKAAAIPNSLSMVSELDEEMGNDLKWLIDFDLRTVFLHDIDGGNHEFELEAVSNENRNPSDEEFVCRRKGIMYQMLQQEEMRSKPKNYILFSYIEMIASCLRETGEATVQTIYKWISERFDDCKMSDSSWKNTIRNTLTVNPLFQKRKPDSGKCHVWFLNRTQSSLKNATRKPRRSRKGPSTKGRMKREKLVSQKKLLAENNIIPPVLPTTIAENIQQNVEIPPECYFPQSWFTTDAAMYESEAGYNTSGPVQVSKFKPEEYFELEIPIVTQYLVENSNYNEPLDIKYLLDESVAPIPLEIIDGIPNTFS